MPWDRWYSYQWHSLYTRLLWEHSIRTWCENIDVCEVNCNGYLCLHALFSVLLLSGEWLPRQNTNGFGDKNIVLFYLLSVCLYYIGQCKTNRKVEGVRKAIRSDHDPWLNLNSGPHCDKSFLRQSLFLCLLKDYSWWFYFDSTFCSIRFVYFPAFFFIALLLNFFKPLQSCIKKSKKKNIVTLLNMLFFIKT